MGVNLIVIVENLKGLNQEEVNEALGVEVFEHKGKREVYPNWELFEWEGKSYASWTFTPRTFDGLYDIFTSDLLPALKGEGSLQGDHRFVVYRFHLHNFIASR
jgi:hypothetical protein